MQDGVLAKDPLDVDEFVFEVPFGGGTRLRRSGPEGFWEPHPDHDGLGHAGDLLEERLADDALLEGVAERSYGQHVDPTEGPDDPYELGLGRLDLLIREPIKVARGLIPEGDEGGLTLTV